MKKFFLLMMVSGIAAAAAIAAEPVNLIRNGSFEEVTAQGRPASWDTYLRKGKLEKEIDCRFSRSEAGKNDKSAACITVVNPVKSNGLAEFYQRIPAKQGAEYYLCGFVKNVSGNSWSNICIEFRDANHGFVGAVQAKPAGVEKAGEYSKVEAGFKVSDPGIKYLHISLRLQDLGHGVALFDDLSLIELPKE